MDRKKFRLRVLIIVAVTVVLVGVIFYYLNGTENVAKDNNVIENVINKEDNVKNQPDDNNIIIADDKEPSTPEFNEYTERLGFIEEIDGVKKYVNIYYGFTLEISDSVTLFDGADREYGVLAIKIGEESKIGVVLEGELDRGLPFGEFINYEKQYGDLSADVREWNTLEDEINKRVYAYIIPSPLPGAWGEKVSNNARIEIVAFSEEEYNALIKLLETFRVIN